MINTADMERHRIQVKKDNLQMQLAFNPGISKLYRHYLETRIVKRDEQLRKMK